MWEEAEVQLLDKHRILSPENYSLPLNFMHFKHAIWLCGVPKEQTAQLALKESQPYVRSTFFHNETTTTESDPGEFLFQIEKFKVPAGFKQNLPPFSPNRPKVCFGSRLTLDPLRSVVGGCGMSQGEGGLWCT